MQPVDPRVIRIAARHGVDRPYTPAALAEAQALARDFAPEDDPSLEDLTGLPFCTIDNEDSRDLDQALAIERTDSGWRVDYALADGALIRPGTALFAEALERGASFYLPGIAYPMLPRILSEGVVSLNPGVTRRALILRMHLDADAGCTGTDVVRGRVRSIAKLTYAGVQRFLDGEQAMSGPFTDSLEQLRAVGELRIAEARRRHVVRYDRGVRLRVEKYNEQISLLCNIEGARLLAESLGHPAVQGVFRAHAAPPPERLAELADLTRDLCAAHGLDPGTWRWNREQPLDEYLEGLPSDHRVARAIQRQAVMVNVRSLYQESPGPHFGVGAASYARFSAPMREIVGIYTHREALELLGLEPATADLVLRDEVVRAGNRSKDIQRRIDKDAERLVIDDLLEPELDRHREQRRWHRGTVMGLTPTRIYVQLDDPRLDLKVYDRKHHPTIGSSIRLRVRKRDRRKRWAFDLRA